MPLVSEIKTKTGCISIWRIEEDLSYFTEHLPTNTVSKELSSITHPRKKTEWAASRFLVQKMNAGNPVSISKNEMGKPFLKNNSKHISWSHSADYVAVILSDLPCGIDIEPPQIRIEKIAPKFMSEHELRKLDSSNNHVLTTCWTIKEAIYKWANQQGISFKKDIQIQPFTWCKEESEIIATLYNRPLAVTHLYIHHVELTYIEHPALHRLSSRQ